MIHLRAAKEVKHIEDLDCNFFVASSVRPKNNGILLLKIVKCLKSFVPSRQFHLNPSRNKLCERYGTLRGERDFKICPQSTKLEHFLMHHLFSLCGIY